MGARPYDVPGKRTPETERPISTRPTKLIIIRNVPALHTTKNNPQTCTTALAKFDREMIILHTMKSRKNIFSDDEKAFIVAELRSIQKGDHTRLRNNDVVGIIQKSMSVWLPAVAPCYHNL